MSPEEIASAIAGLAPMTRRVYFAVCEMCEAANGAPPTYEKVMRTMKFRSKSTVNYHFERLIEAGLLEKLSYKRYHVVGGHWVPPVEIVS